VDSSTKELLLYILRDSTKERCSFLCWEAKSRKGGTTQD